MSDGYGPDLRIFIGWMFAILGSILVGFGLLSPGTHAPRTASNVNLEWGLVLLVFAALMLALGYRAHFGAPRSAATQQAATEPRK
jgi:hypothetical protein